MIGRRSAHLFGSIINKPAIPNWRHPMLKLYMSNSSAMLQQSLSRAEFPMETMQFALFDVASNFDRGKHRGDQWLIEA